MKVLISIAAAMILSCTAAKPTDAGKSTVNSSTAILDENVPACIAKLIAKFKAEEKQNPPRQVISYSYKGQTVYYITAPCCDFFSDLYDANCSLLGHPDGGITGKGDGTLPDFKDMKTNEKLIWKDERK